LRRYTAADAITPLLSMIAFDADAAVADMLLPLLSFRRHAMPLSILMMPCYMLPADY